MSKILFFGDSITAFRENVVVASELFEKSFPQHQMVNRGVKGNHTGMARERFLKDVLEEKPDLMIFSFGINDAAIDVFKQKTTPRVSLEEYVENLRFFIREVRAAGAEVIFFTPPPMVMVEKLKQYYGGEPYLSNGFNFMLDKFISAAKALMAEENVPVADVNAAFRESTGNDEEKLVAILPDGMHPDSAGQKIIYETLLKVFEKSFSGR
jgi:lysophospholipase L1-like esterase